MPESFKSAAVCINPSWLNIYHIYLFDYRPENGSGIIGVYTTILAANKKNKERKVRRNTY
jgi:hypothetical protein